MHLKLFSVCIPQYTDLLYMGQSDVSVGDIVLVPLRNKQVIGVIWSKSDIEIENLSYAVKNIICVIKQFKLNDNTIEFIIQTARKTLVNKNLILKMVLGPLIKRHKIILQKQSQTFSYNNDINTHQLSHEQQLILSDILQCNDSVYVLNGVTGSGKTELYLYIAKEIVKNQGQVLILLPEILLTTQVLNRANNIFGFEISCWHSQIKPRKKDSIWIGVQNCEIKIVIGTRSALFLPFKNLQMIIMDEEHDASFKQESNPIYHARDIALLKSYIFQSKTLLVSATPSIETMSKVYNHEYKYFVLKNKHFAQAKTDIQIANMWKVKKTSNGILPMLHSISIQAIATALANNEQSIIFLNRKGYAATTMCRNCMKHICCKHCDIKLTYYKHNKYLKCRHCGYIIKEQKTCGICGQDSLFTYSPGIERLHEEVQQLFPNAKILVVTRDTEEEAQEIIYKILHNEVNIIIGTQVLAKGLHFANLSLCIVIDANNTRFSGDIRSLEKTYQIIQQVIGRVGREKSGKAIIQTFIPKSQLIQSIAAGNKEDFIKLELENRKIAQVPPYGNFILINFSAVNENKLKNWLSSIHIPESNQSMKVFGPMPAAITRIHKKYRYQILFKSVNDICDFTHQWINSLIIPYYIFVSIDVNPINFY